MGHSQMEILLLFGRNVELDKVQFVGGEPLLNPHLASFITLARRLGFRRAAVTTNGIAPWARYRSLIENGLTDLSFSLDGANKEIHDRLRPTASGVSSFDKTIANIKRSVKEGLRNNLKTRINHTIFTDNFHEAENMIRLSASLGVHSIRIHFALPGDGISAGAHASSSIKDWLIKPDQWINLVSNCNSFSKELGIPIYIPQVFGYSEVDRIPYLRPGYLQVRPDNTLIMCNTHDRLPRSRQRWFARVLGEETIEVNNYSVVSNEASSSNCCKAIPLLISSYPKCVKAVIASSGGLGCTYLPSPLVTHD